MIGLASSQFNSVNQPLSAEFDGVNDSGFQGVGENGILWKPGTSSDLAGFTFSFWVKIHTGTTWWGSSGGSTTDKQIISKGVDSSHICNIGFHKDGSNARVKFYMEDANVSISAESADDDVLLNKFGNWVHIAISVNRTGNCVIYIDGSVSSTTDVSAGSSIDFDKAGGLSLGKGELSSTSSTDIYSAYRLHAFAWFNAALDANNIAAIYNEGRPFNLMTQRGNYNTLSNLKVYWMFGQGIADFNSVKNAGVLGTFNQSPGRTVRNQILAHENLIPPGADIVSAQPTSGNSPYGVTGYGNNTAAYDSTEDAIKITYVDNTQGANCIWTTSNILTTNPSAWHLIQYDIKTTGEGVVFGTFLMDYFYVSQPTSDWITVSQIATTVIPNSVFLVVGYGMTTGEVSWIRNVKIQDVSSLRGHIPSATVFFDFSTDVPPQG